MKDAEDVQEIRNDVKVVQTNVADIKDRVDAVFYDPQD